MSTSMTNLLKSSFLPSVWAIIRTGKPTHFIFREVFLDRVWEPTVFSVSFSCFSSGGGSLFTNSNWFEFEDESIDNEHSAGPNASSLPDAEEHMDVDRRADDDVEKDEADGAVSNPPESNVPSDKTPEWVEWRESSDSLEPPPVFLDAFQTAPSSPIHNSEFLDYEAKSDDFEPLQSADVDEGSR